MLDGNIYFLLKHLAVIAGTAVLFCLFGWWLRGLFRGAAPAAASDEDPARKRKLNENLDAAREQAKAAVHRADELQAELKKALNGTVPRSDLIAAQNALADERARAAELHERIQKAGEQPTQEMLIAAEQRALAAEAAHAELRTKHEEKLADMVPRHELVAAQQALADEQARAAETHERLEQALAKSEPLFAEIPGDSDPAVHVFGKPVAQDDLKIVEGIGPKIEQLLKSNGFETWAALADATAPQIRAVLHAAGTRFSRHDPTTWPLQSRLAHEGKWGELKRWQDHHIRGKPTS